MRSKKAGTVPVGLRAYVYWRFCQHSPLSRVRGHWPWNPNVVCRKRIASHLHPTARAQCKGNPMNANGKPLFLTIGNPKARAAFRQSKICLLILVPFAIDFAFLAVGNQFLTD